MTLWKSTKAAIVATPLIITGMFISNAYNSAADASVTAPIETPTQITQQAKTDAASTRCSVRLGRDFSEGRSSSERLSRGEAMAAERAACEQAKAAQATTKADASPKPSA
ncbi:MAG: hypothetical protein CL561_10600 [Alphaproteobacteria bacterium]|nr:hypothetical protein [Alphaproteobacteria bacterium]|tara:strand:+ start:269370 stop:269699 length:330 start_codon:yes stop_codon:yes gene_type:complete